MHTVIPYAPRDIAFLRVIEHDAWRVKLYSIALSGDRFDESRFAAALDMALGSLPQPAVAGGRAGVAFCIMHQGRGADYVVLAWWDRENELPLRVFVRPATENGWRAAQGGESVCVWDLQVIAFERDSYVATLMADPPQSVNQYLEHTR